MKEKIDKRKIGFLDDQRNTFIRYMDICYDSNSKELQSLEIEKIWNTYDDFAEEEFDFEDDNSFRMFEYYYKHLLTKDQILEYNKKFIDVLANGENLICDFDEKPLFSKRLIEKELHFDNLITGSGLGKEQIIDDFLLKINKGIMKQFGSYYSCGFRTRKKQYSSSFNFDNIFVTLLVPQRHKNDFIDEFYKIPRAGLNAVNEIKTHDLDTKDWYVLMSPQRFGFPCKNILKPVVCDTVPEFIYSRTYDDNTTTFNYTIKDKLKMKASNPFGVIKIKNT